MYIKQRLKYLFIGSVFFCLLMCKSVIVNAATCTTYVNIFGLTYRGIYDGEVENGQPNGSGTFQSDDEYENPFSISGNWEEGVLNSRAKVKFADGSYISAKFENGFMEGRVREYFEDGSYQTYKCGEGIPYGSIKIYTENGKLVDFDWFYEAERISELKEESEEVSYSDLIYFPENAYGLPIKVVGTVREVYATTEDTIFVLEDNEGQQYIYSYVSTASVRYGQARTANLSVGDKITAYGYLNPMENIVLENLTKAYLAIEKNEEQRLEENDLLVKKNLTETEESAKTGNSIFETSLPVFRLICSELLEEEPFDRVNANFSYEDINRFSLYYSGENHTVEGEVVNLNVNNVTQRIQLLVRENSSDGIFYCAGDYTNLEELPIVGDQISVSGMLYGNYKIFFQPDIVNGEEISKAEYVIYPRLNIKKIEKK